MKKNDVFFFFFLVVFIYLLFQEEEEEDGQVYTLEGAGRLVQQQFFSEWAPGWRLGAAARPHLGRSTRGRAGPGRPVFSLSPVTKKRRRRRRPATE